ncbi:hypothetical protein L1987_02990 [Smallanthus sonchifolius]|uniref:Uncharacterized protein n=1 Tax=Smallanthus sonchifolius TaxID=185202 RepID=A0ACB9K9I3_9ASTR|nr:hypothetical protein L1987_02990 [Smallanthus sonchifolius]
MTINQALSKGKKLRKKDLKSVLPRLALRTTLKPLLKMERGLLRLLTSSWRACFLKMVTNLIRLFCFLPEVDL